MIFALAVGLFRKDIKDLNLSREVLVFDNLITMKTFKVDNG